MNPRKAGTTVDFDGTEVPVFGSVAEAMEETGADVTVIFVPPKFAKAAVVEAIDAEIPLAVVITEGIAVHDSAAFWAYAGAKGNKTRIIGPNCPGLITPGQSNAGIIPGDITKPGRIGLVSKSGTLTYQMMYELRDIGFSSAVGIGGDPVIGTTHIDALAAFEADPDTDLIVMIGEIGGDAEERAADFIKENVTKPVVGYVAGFTAPEGKTMGHAGAIVSGSSGTAAGEEGGPGGRRRQGRQDADRDRPAGARDPRRLTADRVARLHGADQRRAGPHPLSGVRARARSRRAGPASGGCAGTSRSGPCAGLAPQPVPQLQRPPATAARAAACGGTPRDPLAGGERRLVVVGGRVQRQKAVAPMSSAVKRDGRPRPPRVPGARRPSGR